MRGIDVQLLFDRLPKNPGWEGFLMVRNKRMSPFVMFAIDKILPNLDADAVENAFNRLVHLTLPMGEHRIRVVKETTPTQCIVVVFLDPMGMIFERSSVAKGVIHDE